MKLRALRGRAATAPVEPGPADPARPTPPWRRLRVPPPRELRAALMRNPGLKAVSLLLAFFLWFSINVSERDAEGTLEVPLRVRALAAGLIVTSQPVKPIAITVRGPRTILDGVDERRTRMTIDLSDVAPGELRQELNADMLRPELPRRLKVVRIEVWEVRDAEGLLLQSVMSNGDTYGIRNTLDMVTTSFSYGNAAQGTLYTESREGNEIRLEGTLRGKPLSRVSRIDERPVYESVERSLQEFAISGSSQTIYFWIVLPADALIFQLMAHREGREVVDVAGERVEAERVKVSLPGLASILWSSLYWYRPTDGTFLRSECVRGLIGTPKTVLQLVEGDRLQTADHESLSLR